MNVITESRAYSTFDDFTYCPQLAYGVAIAHTLRARGGRGARHGSGGGLCLFEFDQGAGEILWVQEQNGLAVGAGLRLAVS